MKSHLALVSLMAAMSALALECSVAAVQAIIGTSLGTVHVLSAVQLMSNGTYGNPNDIAYPINATNLPASCVVVVNVTSSATSAYQVGLMLPNAWNSRLLAVGNGGLAGGINWLDMGAGVQYGFAVMSTDTGHNSTSGDSSWALNQPQKRIDWGYRAMHGSVVLAKQLIVAYYGRNIDYSYYSGCSTGGRQGLKEVQMYPEDFDGVLAGAPAWWTSHLQTWTVKVGLTNQNGTGHIPTSLFPIINNEAFNQCDGADGLLDGIITDPQTCDFHPETLLCTSSNQTNCLTSAQLQTLYKLYAVYFDTNQSFVLPSFEVGSETQWPVLLGQQTPNALGTGYVQNFLLNDPSWDWRNFDYAIVQLADQINPGNATAANFDLRPFHAHGGKLLTYHGYADGLIPSQSTPYYYNHVRGTLSDYAAAGDLGAANALPLDDWYRLFMVPGMQHCTTGVNGAPWYFAGANQARSLGTGVHSVPGFSDAQHDILLALMAWVENGTAPDAIVATSWVNDTVALGLNRQRPLCVYPKSSRYTAGDPNLPGSFVCA